MRQKTLLVWQVLRQSVSTQCVRQKTLLVWQVLRQSVSTQCVRQKTLLVCDRYSDRASAHSAWGRRLYLCVTGTQTERQHTVREAEDFTCVWQVLRQSVSTQCVRQKTLLVCDRYSDRASAHSAWGRRLYLCVTGTQTERQHTVREAEDITCVMGTQTERQHTVREAEDITCVRYILRQSVSTHFHLGLCELCVQAELNQKHKNKICVCVSWFVLVVMLASRRTLVQFCFGSSSSSKIVACGCCLETLSLTINGTLKRHLSLPI